MPSDATSSAVGVVSLIFNALPPDNPANGKYGLDMQAASAFLSAFAVVSATGLISYRLLKARREVSGVLHREDSGIYTKVVATMIESAVPLAVFGVLVAASNFLHGTPGRVAFTVITGYIWEVLAVCSVAVMASVQRMIGANRSVDAFPTANHLSSQHWARMGGCAWQ
jgi:hypothetical protein